MAFTRLQIRGNCGRNKEVEVLGSGNGSGLMAKQFARHLTVGNTSHGIMAYTEQNNL